MEIFFGLDVSMPSTSICVLGTDDRVVTEAKVYSNPGSLVEHMRGLPRDPATVAVV